MGAFKQPHGGKLMELYLPEHQADEVQGGDLDPAVGLGVTIARLVCRLEARAHVRVGVDLVLLLDQIHDRRFDPGLDRPDPELPTRLGTTGPAVRPEPGTFAGPNQKPNARFRPPANDAGGETARSG